MSVFSEIPPTEWIASNRSGFAILDRFPVTEGHALVISRREIPTWWDAAPDEQADLMALVDQVRTILDERYAPDGYNVGFNAGSAAGQTVDHLHIHMIPRHHGDMEDPRGGVRHVIPERGNYMAPPSDTARQPAGEPTSGTQRELLLVDSLGPRMMRHELDDALRDPGFDRVDLLVSFIMKSGLGLIRERLDEALERGAVARVLTTDYLHITDADALALLLDLRESHHDSTGSLAIRVFSDPLTSFHPKAYLFHSSRTNAALGFVGSNNLSRSGIDGGVEWSLGVDSVQPLVASFDRLWSDPRSRPLNHEFLRSYRNQWRVALAREDRPVEVDIELEEPAAPVAPRPLQLEGLEALKATRNAGHNAGLVVMATGLGKTWLAAFDSTAFIDSDAPMGARDSAPDAPAGARGRILFIAHREEILTQSRDVYRQVAPSLELGLYNGSEKQPDADVVFASIQTISRRLDLFDPDEFDYIVIDEFHHAAAPSYRRTVDHFTPRFLLGLTATPERMDGADLLALCGDNLVFERGLVEGINRSELVPFQYWGVADVVDYEPIPWRSGRFDPQALTEAVETRARAQHSLDLWRTRCNNRTLAFCVSITHADFMAEYFNAAGVRSVAVHSGPDSYSRVDAIKGLRTGEIQVVFTVDVFNEGVDIPEIDSVMMLRPTGSPVIFLQQLGRGLRLSDGKDHLTVVDFVGNHSSFLIAPRVLAGLSSNRTLSQTDVVRAVQRGEFDLPAGCSVNFDLELVDLFQRLVAARRQTKIGALASYCLEIVDETGFRPSAVQVHAAGFDPAVARASHGGWFSMLADLGLLSDEEQAVVDAHGSLLLSIETESISKSYKLVTLRALIADGTLRTGTTVDAVSARSHRLVSGDPRLVLDVRSKSIPDPTVVPMNEWRNFWRKNPLVHLAKPKGEGPALFDLDGDRFTPNFSVDEASGETFDQMVGEIVDWRLAGYLLGGSAGAVEEDDVDGPDEEVEVDPAYRLDRYPDEMNAHLIGQRFKRDQVSIMFGLEFNQAKWNLGHVSLGEDAVLFVTLNKSSAMQYGSDYVDHFESPSQFVWASQNSVGPESKKGREVLDSPGNGVRIHLFVRAKKSDVAFEYCGLVEPVSHHGSKPMSVTFQLLQPLSGDAARRFGA
ncbi:MAG: DUF3427 domain-containing protein [Microthrixaceae bacterium]|nr:DUF3427 domain-containing protein [Microthrixaceae bacterium]